MFIAIEGPDGSGKTTLALKLQSRLRAAGAPDVQLAPAPSPGPIGQLIRQQLSNASRAAPHNALKLELDQMEMAHLFVADHAFRSRTVIEPALKHGSIIIADRTTLSTLIYQSALSGDTWESFRRVLAVIESTPILRPDLLLVLQATEEVLGVRLRDRGKISSLDVFERGNLQDVIAKYNQLPSDAYGLAEEVQFLRADSPFEEVQKEAMNHVLNAKGWSRYLDRRST